MDKHPVFCACRLCLTTNRQTHQIDDLQRQLQQAREDYEYVLKYDTEIIKSRITERDKWRGIADCSELDGFLGPSGEPECQGGDKIPSEPMCLKHQRDAALKRGAQAYNYVRDITSSAYAWRYYAIRWQERIRGAVNERDRAIEQGARTYEWCKIGWEGELFWRQVANTLAARANAAEKLVKELREADDLYGPAECEECNK